MKLLKKVKQLIPAYDVNMGGIIIKQALPTQKVDQVDPFLLLHHGKMKFRDDVPAKRQGLDPHPHRGFSPVTFVIDGEVHHRDSRGNNHIAKKGEVQWMNAGMGIIHSERPSEELVKQNSYQEILQLWINSPAHVKMKQPYYQHISIDNMPIIDSEDGKVINKLIAGSFRGETSKTRTESKMMIIWSNAQQTGMERIGIPAVHNSMLYLVAGKIRIAGYGQIERKTLAVFDKEGEIVEIETLEDSEFILFTGKPLNEKVEQQGPFVMNNQTQIMEAYRDYQMGKMGILIEED